MEPTPPDSRPALSARDASYHEAVAGIAAREAAAEMGGDPAQIRAVVAAASGTGAPALPSSAPCLAGLPLHEDNLLVTLCLNLHARAFGTDPRALLAEPGTRMQAIASLAYIFTQPQKAFEVLDPACDPDTPPQDQKEARRSFRLESVAFAARFGSSEIETLTRHLVALARRHSGDDPEPEPEAAPGELPPPPAGAS